MNNISDMSDNKKRATANNVLFFIDVCSLINEHIQEYEYIDNIKTKIEISHSIYGPNGIHKFQISLSKNGTSLLIEVANNKHVLYTLKTKLCEEKVSNYIEDNKAYYVMLKRVEDSIYQVFVAEDV